MKSSITLNNTDRSFLRTVHAFHRTHGRHELPWRSTRNPYHILVSEMMLQQTQVPRVIPFYRSFLRRFPSFRALASSKTGDVLRAWQGLGYNRRALMLRRCAQAVVRDHRGRLPADFDVLRSLPGIGPYTAGAVLAFAFDERHPVIETNIRRVYLHHFFSGKQKVPDARIMPLVAKHVANVRSPRRWYGALMDYGTHLASEVPNPNRRSRQYVRQPGFEGSLRQLRGRVLRYLTRYGVAEHAALSAAIGDNRLPQALEALQREGFIRVAEALVHLAG